MVLQLISTLLPELGCMTRSLTSVDIVLPRSLKSPLTTRGVVPNGEILTSSISSNVSGATADANHSSCAVPFGWVPVVCVGSLPLVAVVPCPPLGTT